MKADRTWRNPDSRTQNHKKSRAMHQKKKRRRRVQYRQKTHSRSKRSSAANKTSPPLPQDALLTGIKTLATHVDLPKVRTKLEEANQVLEQMNGLFQQFSQFQSSDRQTPGRRHPGGGHPYPQAQPLHHYNGGPYPYSSYPYMYDPSRYEQRPW